MGGIVLLVAVFLLLPFILIAVLFSKANGMSKEILRLKEELARLRKEFASVYELFLDLKKSRTQKDQADEKSKEPDFKPAVKPEVIVPQTAASPIIPAKQEIPPPSPVPVASVVASPSALPPKPEIPRATPLPTSEGLRPAVAATSVRREKADKSAEAAPRPRSTPTWEDKWEEFKDNVDWEQFTGIKLFAWLGGLALFIAAVFFVKYSIDNNLIPPQVRLAIGGLVGLAMIIASLMINRERYTTTAHSLAAGGIAVLYAVSFTTCVYYGFIPKIAGFALFVIISAAAFVLAVFHQGRFISVLGAIGAYATPLLIQTGHPNLLGLFGYLTIVNIGLFEVIRRTDWRPLTVLLTCGTLLTLAAGAWGTKPPASNELICIIALANLTVFSIFFRLYRGYDPANPSVVASLRIVFLSILAVAFVMLKDNGFLPLILVGYATLAALILCYKEKDWSAGFIFYSFLGFLLIAFWALTKFDLTKPSWEMLVFFAYAMVAGLGPVFVIRKNGVDPDSLKWLKVFPVALVVVAVIVFIKAPQAHFAFWPLLLGLNIIGIFVGLLVGSLYSVTALIVLFIVAGIKWIFVIPAGFRIGNEFFLTLLVAGLILCFVTILFLRKLSQWNPLKGIEEIKSVVTPEFIVSSSWISSFPVLGPFILLALVLYRQQPIAPNPAMATGLCFFAVLIFLAKRIKSQELLIVSLIAMATAELSWGLLVGKNADPNFILLCWSSFFWLTSVILPCIIFRKTDEWKMVWFGWALFELAQALLIIRASDVLWAREIVGWFPLGLTIIKLPLVAYLVRKLEGCEERNPILAFHGGVLLFYVSSIAVLLLGNAWLGMTLVIEAMLLLWLNRRVEHPGLRWVSLFMAPIGFILLMTHLGALKTAASMPVLNLAVLSVAICVAALGISVRLSGFPQKELRNNFSLPDYFLWLAVGAGFYLLNLIVADIFGGTGGGFKFNPAQDINQFTSYLLLWTIFGAFIWRISRMPVGLKIVGLIMLICGSLFSIFSPFYFARTVMDMPPLFNLGLIIFLPVIAVLVYLAIKQDKDSFGGEAIKNLFISIFLIAILAVIQLELSTVFHNRMAFNVFGKPLPAMALALIASWFIYGLCLLLWPRELHQNFRVAGAILIVISVVRACLFPLRYAVEFGSMTPLLNIPSLIFILMIGALAVLALRTALFKQATDAIIISRKFWGTVLIIFSFYVINVEVASFFGAYNNETEQGKFTFYTHGRFSQQLAYSISWLIFALGSLIFGIRRHLISLRWVGLGLIVATALKVFVKDLWALGSLYRVGSFIGLAATLLLVSLLYQHFFGEKKDADSKTDHKHHLEGDKK